MLSSAQTVLLPRLRYLWREKDMFLQIGFKILILLNTPYLGWRRGKGSGVQGPEANRKTFRISKNRQKATIGNFDCSFRSFCSSRIALRGSMLFSAVPPPFSLLSLLLLLLGGVAWRGVACWCWCWCCWRWRNGSTTPRRQKKRTPPRSTGRQE